MKYMPLLIGFTKMNDFKVMCANYENICKWICIFKWNYFSING